MHRGLEHVQHPQHQTLLGEDSAQAADRSEGWAAYAEWLDPFSDGVLEKAMPRKDYVRRVTERLRPLLEPSDTLIGRSRLHHAAMLGCGLIKSSRSSYRWRAAMNVGVYCLRLPSLYRDRCHLLSATCPPGIRGRPPEH